MAQAVMLRQALHELEQHFAGLLHTKERWDWFVWFIQQVDKRFEQLELVEATIASGRLSLVAHQQYLPAAHAYRAFLMSSAGHHRCRAVAYSLRGQLGAQSKRLYVAQRPVFDLSIKIILSFGGFVVAGMVGASGPLTVSVVGAFLATPLGRACMKRLWDWFKHAEAHWLSQARQLHA